MSREFFKEIVASGRCMVVAEGGINHCGSIDLAKKLVEAAKFADVDAIKFQIYKTENLVSRYAYGLPYFKGYKDQYELLKKYELNQEQLEELSDYARRLNLILFFSVFDQESLDIAIKLKSPIIKIPSCEITNLPFLERIASLKIPVILSTGAATLNEINTAISIIKKYIKDIIILHCRAEYPASLEDLNLKMIQTLRIIFDLPVGFSDHTRSIEVPIAAVALGAILIEKHFILNRKIDTPDKQVSILPNELKKLVKCIRRINAAVGNGIKSITQGEMALRDSAYKVVVAKRYLPKNSVISEEDITYKRAGKGISPKDASLLINKRLKKDIPQDYPLQWTDIF